MKRAQVTLLTPVSSSTRQLRVEEWTKEMRVAESLSLFLE
jgi:hypothetical protein